MNNGTENLKKQNMFYEVVKLANSGMAKTKISKTLKISNKKVEIYLETAKKLDLITVKTKYEQTIEMYNSGIVQKNKISKKLEISYKTVETYLQRAAKKGEIQEKSLYETIVEFYKSGITDSKAIAEKMQITKETVNKYLKQAEEEGLIEIKNLYDKILELYKSGIRQYKEIAEILEIDKVTVKRYLKKAESLGQIKTISRKEEIRQERKKLYDQIIIIYNSGITIQREIAKKLGISQMTVCNYLKKAREENLLKEKYKNNLMIKDEKYDEIMSRLKRDYPIKVAKDLNIPSYRVYDTIEHLTNKEAKKLKTERIKNNALYEKVEEISRSKQISFSQALVELSKTAKTEETINLAKLFYYFRKNKNALYLLDSVLLDKSISNDLRQSIKEEKKCIIGEVIASKLRRAYKENNCITAEFISICKKYQVSSNFLQDILNRNREYDKNEEVIR